VGAIVPGGWGFAQVHSPAQLPGRGSKFRRINVHIIFSLSQTKPGRT